MGMGYGANFVVSLSVEQVAEQSLKMGELLLKLAEYDVEPIEFFRSVVDEDESVVEDGLTATEYATFKESLEQIVVEFEEENGIAIMPAYHNKEDEGSCYDQINGAFFEVPFRQFFNKTEAAINLEQKFDVKEVLYVNFG